MDQLREHIVAQLRGGQAFDTFDQVVAGFDPRSRGAIPRGAEHSAWQILEHMRLSLRDILDFSQNEDGSYLEKDWPADYWPEDALPAPDSWEESIAAYKADLAEMENLVTDPKRDLFKPFPWGQGQTLLREALLACDHAAYHIGELIELERWVKTASDPSL